MFQDDNGTVGKGRSTHTWLGVGVPGTVMGLEAARTKYGSMSRQQLMQPAIALARKGYVLRQGDVNILHTRSDDFAASPNFAAICLDNVQPYRVGETLKQPQLARTLSLIEKSGPDAFYRGPIAQALVMASIANGGILTMKDLANYQVRWHEPVKCGYRGYTIVSAPPPSSGGATICRILNIAAPYPLDQWGYGDERSVHVLAEAERRAFADRNTWLGDRTSTRLN